MLQDKLLGRHTLGQRSTLHGIHQTTVDEEMGLAGVTQHLQSCVLCSQGDAGEIDVGGNILQTDRLQGLLLGAVDYIVKSYANEEEIGARIAINLQKSNYPRTQKQEDRSLNDSLPGAALVRAAKKVFLHHIEQPPGAHELALQLGSNEKKLNDAFREQYGMTAFGWLRDERLRMARILLSNIELPIIEIAQSLGYSSAQNFATGFKDHFGCSPSQFRDGLQVKRS